MRRVAAFILALCISAVASSAQTFGVVGGFTSSGLKVKDVSKTSVSGYHVGAAFNCPLISGLAIQPQLQYNVKGTSLASLKTDIGYIELPVQLQWGLDLVLLRPYVFAEPFIGYAVNWKASENHTSISSDLNLSKLKGRMEYGLSLGGGIEVYKRVQLSVKYFWNFEDCGVRDYFGLIKDSVTERKSFDGLAFSVGVFF